MSQRANLFVGNKGQRGSALIVVLSVIVLLTGVTLAFFIKSRNLRMIEASGAGRIRSEILAQSAIVYTVGLLTHEVTDPASSTPLAITGGKLFLPKTPLNFSPKLQIKTSLNSARTHMPGLIKQSIPAMDPLATAISSGTTNRVGRSVEVSRWNEPWFYFSSGPFNVPARAPNWIYFDDSGATATASASIQGRAAFNIYQVDSLLDLSVAGYPSALNGDVVKINALKSTLAGADLTKIGAFVAVLDDPSNRFVDVRSRRSVRDGSYLAKVLGNRNGFLEPPAGDTQFVSRLDLLRFSRSVQLNNNPLAYLSAWMRTLEAPSWNPPTPTAANLFAPAVLRTSDATINVDHLDGSVESRDLKEGTPVASRRFPLSRLGWFDASPSAQRNTALARYFSLTAGGNGVWLYQDSGIKTLSELAGEGREPNFFEMLKAAIVTGSLGKAFATGDAALSAERDGDADLQILRIGACIIDSAGGGNHPTVLAINRGAGLRYVCGVKDLPYLYGVRFRQIVKTDSAGSVVQIDQLAIPILVNPHATALAVATRPPVRLRMEGAVVGPSATIAGNDVALTPRIVSGPVGVVGPERVMAVESGAYRYPSPVLEWTPPSGGSLPEMAQPQMPDYFTESGRAFWLASGNGSPAPTDGKAELENFNLVMEYWNGVIWVPYDALIGDGRGYPATGLGASTPVTFSSTAAEAPGNVDFAAPDTLYFLKPDPRTNRWGIARGKTASDPWDADPRRRLPDTAATSYIAALTPSGVFPAVADPDQLVRENDLQIGSALGVKEMKHPLGDTWSQAITNVPSEERMPILHRPFYTVGELGAVFRDQPWKTLDFATPASGDAALLDYFCIQETGPDAIVAGRINLNLQSPPDTLDNQMAGTSFLIGGSTALGKGEVELLRQEIVNVTRTAPFTSPAGLVGVPAVTKLSDPLKSSKQRREAAVRALGSAGQTRTWNFFVDLIAQSGNLAPASSTNLGQDFMVQGEYRFWLHVAIDRLTGKVIASHLEAYQE